MLWQSKLACLYRLLLYIFIITALANKKLELSLNKVYFLIPQEDFDYNKNNILAAVLLKQLCNMIQDLTILL